MPKLLWNRDSWPSKLYAAQFDCRNALHFIISAQPVNGFHNHQIARLNFFQQFSVLRSVNSRPPPRLTACILKSTTNMAGQSRRWHRRPRHGSRKPWARTKSMPVASQKKIPRKEAARNPSTAVSNMSAPAAALPSGPRGKSIWYTGIAENLLRENNYNP